MGNGVTWADRVRWFFTGLLATSAVLVAVAAMTSGSGGAAGYVRNGNADAQLVRVAK